MKIGWPQLIGAALACALLVGAGFALANLRRDMQPTPIEIIPPQPTSLPPVATAEPTATVGPYHVYVSGAVVNPAVYELAPGSIIDDAVRAAGGFAADADTAAVNLAQPAVDGMQVHVPVMGEAAATPPPISLPAGGAPPSRMGRRSPSAAWSISISPARPIWRCCRALAQPRPRKSLPIARQTAPLRL